MTWSKIILPLTIATRCRRSQFRILRHGCSYKRYVTTSNTNVNDAANKGGVDGVDCVKEYAFMEGSAPMLSAAVRRARQLPTTARVMNEPGTSFVYLELDPEWHEVASTFFEPRPLPHADDDDDDYANIAQEVPSMYGLPDVKSVFVDDAFTGPLGYWARRFRRFKDTHIVGVGKDVDETIQNTWQESIHRLKCSLKDDRPMKLLWYFPPSPTGVHISINRQFIHMVGEYVDFEVVGLCCFHTYKMGEPSTFDPELYHAFRLTFNVIVTIHNENFVGHCSYACLGARFQTPS
eukprot:m.158087 g.158087  ORF g.158087 m.158087 type:complete len:292 (+) comp31078_c1_seq1:1339-2214(+)